MNEVFLLVFLKALAALAVMALALGLAGAAGQASGLSGTARQLLAAAVCLTIAVTLITLLRRKVDRLPMAGLGLTGLRQSVKAFTLATVITASSAVVMFAAATAAGLIKWGPVDPGTLVGYVVLNAVIAVALEAFPEELVFRGYMFRTLNQRLRRWTAFLVAVLLFTFAGGASSLVQSAVGALFGLDTPRPGFAPAGEDPVAYAVLYPVFGAALLVARIATGSLWASIALHLTYLTAIRITFDGASRGAGWSADAVTPDAVIVVPGLLLLTALAFLGYAKATGHRVGWRERSPETL